MARFTSQQKRGYYKLPAHLPAIIAGYMKPEDPENTILLDPCAGTGEALCLLGQELGISRQRLYANELDPERAKACRDSGLLNVTCGDGVMEMKTPERNFSLLYLNPPYDFEGDREGRTELKFLQTMRFLREDGILVFVVPLTVLKRKEFVERMPRRLKNITICTFPSADFAAFGQAVLFGRRDYGESPEEVKNYLQQLKTPLVLGDGQLPSSGLYKIPRAFKSPAPEFYTRNLDEHTIAELASSRPVEKALQFGLTGKKDRTVRTLTELRSGHKGVVFASGIMDRAYRDTNGHIVAVTGTTAKTVIKSEEEDEDGRYIERVRTVQTPIVRGLDLTASMKEQKIIIIDYV